MGVDVLSKLIKLLKSIFITSMNARNSCLANKTEIRHSCLFKKITLERGRKTPEMIVPYDRKTHYWPREDLP